MSLGNDSEALQKAEQKLGQLRHDMIKPFFIYWNMGMAGAFILALISFFALPLSLGGIMALFLLTMGAVAAALVLMTQARLATQIVLGVWSVAACLSCLLSGGIDSPIIVVLILPLVASLGFGQTRPVVLGLFLTCIIGLLILVMTFLWPDWIGGSMKGGNVEAQARALFWVGLLSIVFGLGIMALMLMRVLLEQAQWSYVLNERYRAMLSEQPGMIMSFEPGGLVTSAYGTAPKGFEAKVLMGKGLKACVRSEDYEIIDEAFFFAETKGQARVHFIPVRALERTMTLLLRKATDGQIIGTMWDSSFEHSRIQSLQGARFEAEKALEAKTNYLATISHDIRTPLNAVIGFSDTMRQKIFGPLSAKYTDYVQMIWESGHLMLELINDVLDFNRMEAQKYELSLTAFDLRDPVIEVIRLMRAQASQKNIEFKAFMPAKESLIEADKRAIKQILLNIISNALKFTSNSGKIEVRLKAFKTHYELQVRDNGAGMSQEVLRRIGEPFNQGDTEQKPKGSGLGLSIVKRLSQMHGGDLIVQSTSGEGTLVRVRLPFKAKGQTVLPF